MAKEQEEVYYDKDGNRVIFKEPKKKGGCLKWVLIAIGVIIFFTACSALLVGGDDDAEESSDNIEEDDNEAEEETSNEEDSETVDDGEDDADKVYDIGETMSHDDVAITVQDVERIEAGEFDFVEEGYNYIRVNVEIVNDGDDEVSYNPFDFEIENSDGNITDHDMSPSGYSNSALSSGKLSPDGKVDGDLFFEVPADDSGLHLRYEASFWTGETIEFDLDE